MNIKMQKANMLAENIAEFIKFVRRIDENKCGYSVNKEKLYQIKLLIEEYKFRIIGEELKRVNRFDWDEKYTYFLVDSIKEGIHVIDQFVTANSNDLFILSGRLHTLKNLASLFENVGIYR